MTSSRIFLYLCLSFIGGIAAASFFNISLWILFFGFGIGLASIAIFWRDPPSYKAAEGLSKRVVVLGFCAILFFAGALRIQGEVKDDAAENSFKMRKQEVVLRGVVAQDPSPRLQSQQLIIKPESLNGEKWTFEDRKVLVQTNIFGKYEYGDFLEVQGIISEPENFEQFDYKAFLRKEGIYWVMQNPKIEVLGAGHNNIILEKLYAIKHRARETFQEHISSPQSEVLGALVFGEDKLLSKEFLEKLNRVGLRHIIAVSGMNITIIATMIMGMMLWIGFFRSHAFYLTILFIILFIAMIGFPASAVRAGIMGGLFLLAAHVGRLSSARGAIVGASAIMLAINPMLLRFDTGFQLSFAAMLGIILFGEFFEKKLSKVPNWNLFPLRKTLGMTFAAQLGTAPVLLLYFDTFSFITPLTNILIVPLTSPLMMGTIIFAIVASFVPFVAIPIGWLLWLSVNFIIVVTETFAKIPFGSVDLYGSFVRWVLFFAALLGLWYILRLMQKERQTHREYIQSHIHK